MRLNAVGGWTKVLTFKAPRGQRGRALLRVEVLEGRDLPSHGPLDFSTPVTIDLRAIPNSAAVADFDRDGDLDVAAAITAGFVSVALGNGDGTFEKPQPFLATPYPLSSAAVSVATGDFNNDGKPDLVVSNLGPNTISVLLNTSSGETLDFGDPNPFASGSESNFVAVGDLNGDGDLDVATANIGGGDEPIGILLGNGDGTFKPVAFAGAGSNANSLAVGLRV